MKFGMEFRLSLVVFLMLLPQVGVADEDWTVKTNLYGVYGDYSGSPVRDSFSGTGLIVSADYLDQWGGAIGVNYTNLKFKKIKNINQQAIYGSLHYNLYPDALPGSLTIKLDGHTINNNDSTGDTDNVRVVAPQLSFLNYDKTFYADIGYAYSVYKKNLKVHQFTPTIGFAFNQASDWLQIRGFYIDPTNPARSQNKNSTTAVEGKWTHWFSPGAWHHLEKMQISGLGGERIYAVDGDAAVVYNLADIQRGSGSLALQWRLPGTMRLMLMGGVENYLNNLTGNSYDNRFVFVNFSGEW